MNAGAWPRLLNKPVRDEKQHYLPTGAIVGATAAMILSSTAIDSRITGKNITMMFCPVIHDNFAYYYILLQKNSQNFYFPNHISRSMVSNYDK